MINKYINSHSTQSIINNEDFPKGSVIWNGIQKARGMAKARVSWKLGNGEDIQFWTDKWLAQGPLINNQMFERWANACINQYGSKVINYRDGKEWRDLSLICGDLAPIMKMLNPMILSEDELI